MIIEKLTLFKDCGCASKKKSIGLTDIAVAKNIDLDFETEIINVRLTIGSGGGTHRATETATTKIYIDTLGYSWNIPDTTYHHDGLMPLGIGGS